MKKQFTSIAIASVLLAGTTPYAYANDPDSSSNDSGEYIGTGVGAVAGALLAGPVGFLAGGVIGNLVAKHNSSPGGDEPASLTVTGLQADTSAESPSGAETKDDIEQPIVVAQAADLDTVINEGEADQTTILENILIDDMRVDVFFLSGSTSVEPFYKPRMQIIARLMRQIPEIDVHLEGYSDRRGDSDENLILANERLESVRQELVQTGIDAGRIHLNAFGEKGFVSKPGDLEAYTFDRRVEIRFEQTAPRSKSPVALIETAATP